MSKKIIDLKNKNLSFPLNNQTYKVLRFKQSNMTVDVAVYEKDTFIKEENMVFAQIPKSLKKLIKPV